MNKYLIVASLFLLSCKPAIKEKAAVVAPNTGENKSSNSKPGFSIVGNFNGDNIPDTIFELYVSGITGKEIPKPEGDSLVLVTKNKPISKLYTSLSNVAAYTVTKEPEQLGIYHFANLGDLDGDKIDEFGYVIDWQDFSNLNTYHILSIKNGKFTELFTFDIHELINFDDEELFANHLPVKSIAPKTIEYKYYSNEAVVKVGRHRFK